MAQTAPTFTDKDLQHWKFLADFRAALQPHLEACPLHASWADPRRRLQCTDYLSLFLFTLVNPVVTTLRGLSAATQLQRVQAEVSPRPVSLGSFSEAQHLLDPALLEPLLASLSAQVQGPPPTDPRAAWQDWFARDSSLFAAPSHPRPGVTWTRVGLSSHR